MQKQILNNSIPHALLFTGPDKIGKFTLAKLFSQSILCNSKVKTPCGDCNSCLQMDKQASIDYLIIKKEEGKQKITIKQVRELQQKLSLKSFETKYRIIIINDSEYLSEEASNALLKTLEEPNPQTVFIIITSQIQSIAPTIKSRCQILKFNPIPSFQIENWLISRQVDKKTAKVISGISIGRPGKALDYHHNHNLINLQKEHSKIIINLLKSKSISEKFSLASDYLNKTISHEEIIELLDNWELVIRDFILLNKKNNNISNFSFISIIKSMSKTYKQNKFFSYYKLIRDSRFLILQSINSKLVLENLILQI